MFKEDGKIFFESKEEADEYMKEANAPLEKARNNYFAALYAYVEGDSRKFLDYIQENTSDEIENSNNWIMNKLIQNMVKEGASE